MLQAQYIYARETGEVRHDVFRKIVINDQINKLSKPVFTSKVRAAQFHTSCINSIHLDRSEHRYLLSGGADKLIGIFDTHSNDGTIQFTKYAVVGRPQHSKFSHKYSVTAVQWYPHDNGIFTTSSPDCTMKIWDSNALRPVESIPFKNAVNDHHMSSIAVSHNLIAVATEDSFVYLCDMRSGSSSHILQGHKNAILTLRWSTRQPTMLATGGSDNKILIWDIRHARGHLWCLDQHNGNSAGHSKTVVTAHNGKVNGLAFGEDGLVLLSVGTDNRARVWDTYTGKNTMLNFGPVMNKTKSKLQLVSAADTALMFIPTLNNIIMADVDDGVIFKQLKGHFKPPVCCDYNPQTQTLYSAGQDNVILIWAPPVPSPITDVTEPHPKRRRVGETSSSAVAVNQDAWSDSDEEV